MTLLDIRNLRKTYGALAATDDVTLSVAEGELHAIIGPNGAGKTTLVHQLSGLTASDSGTIRFAGTDITRLPMARRVHLGLARSFQITSVLERFTTLENTALAVQARTGSSFRFFAAAAHEAALNTPAEAALAQVGLDPSRPAGTLSHGEKRALEIAIALATGARLLLLDEPLAGTGLEESADIVALLRTLKHTHTIVLIEHDMPAVFALADRITVLVAGRVIATGTPDQIRRDPTVREAYLGEED